MLAMIVELWPFGDETRAKRLVTINLANMGPSPQGDGYSYVWTIDEPKPLNGDPIHETGTLHNYDRDASCVDMLDTILTDYKVRGGPPDLTKLERDTAERMRDKTNPPPNRFPY